VNRDNPAPIPDAIAQLQGQLDQFRSTRPHRTKLPESLWQAAVDLARQHGVYAVAHPLRLDYTRLKERLGGRPRSLRRGSKSAFVELLAPPLVTLGECVIEIESTRGDKMRIQWKAAAPPDWEKLFRAWRDASA
jgi:hypothetical protein